MCNKSVIFHLVHKQIVTLRWAIAYYGIPPAGDISKQSRITPRERPGSTNGECVLTSQCVLSGVWTSSSRGNPGRQCTCYGWTREQTEVRHLSSCQLRHKLCTQARGWIMNITEVKGLWDSFITLTNTISPRGGGWGGRTRRPYASSALQNSSLNFSSLVWLLIHPLSLIACPILLLMSVFRHWLARIHSERGCRKEVDCVWSGSDDSLGLCDTTDRNLTLTVGQGCTPRPLSGFSSQCDFWNKQSRKEA